MRRFKERAHAPVAGQIVHAVAGADDGVYRMRKRQAAHVLAGKLRADTALTRLLRGAFQHFPGNVHTRDAHAPPGEFQRHAAGAAGAVAQLNRLNARLPEQVEIVPGPARIVEIVHQLIVDDCKTIVRFHRTLPIIAI